MKFTLLEGYSKKSQISNLVEILLVGANLFNGTDGQRDRGTEGPGDRQKDRERGEIENDRGTER
jgi:hypothetical protein